MDIGKNINWSDDLEKYLADMGEKSYCYSYLHKKAEERFSKLRTFIDLPVIIGSTVSGVLSVGSSNMFSNNEKMASISIGALSLIVGVVNTIGTYFGWSKRAENHRISSISYGKLFRFITIELGLPRKERMTAGDLLKVCRENYERLQEVAPLIPEDIIKLFKQKFNTAKYENISRPSECNGLEPISIYKEQLLDIMLPEPTNRIVDNAERIAKKVAEEVVDLAVNNSKKIMEAKENVVVDIKP